MAENEQQTDNNIPSLITQIQEQLVYIICSLVEKNLAKINRSKK